MRLTSRQKAACQTPSFHLLGVYMCLLYVQTQNSRFTGMEFQTCSVFSDRGAGCRSWASSRAPSTWAASRASRWCCVERKSRQFENAFVVWNSNWPILKAFTSGGERERERE